jgi:hypothetical protein
MLLSVDQPKQLVERPELGGADQMSGFIKAQNLTRWAFLWGYMKNIVYGEKIRDLRHIRNRIIAAIETVTPDMIQRN